MPGRIEFRTTADGASSATERLRITSAGLVRIPDTGKFTAGAGDDLEIYHDGTGSYITNTTGELQISGGGSTLFIQGVTNENAIKVVPNGAVDLYYDNSKKFETTNTGVTVTGTVSDSIGDLRNIPQSSNSSARTLVATDGGKVVMTTSGGWVIPASVMSQGNTVTLLNGDGSNQTINATALNAFYNTSDGANIKASTITLGGASMATIWFSSGTVAYISATNMTVS
jgi:hypothetical protein